MVEEVDGFTGEVVAEYLNGRGLDEPLAAVLAGVNGGEPVYFHQDHLGSVELLTDADGNVLQRYRYDIHGNATVLDAAGNEGFFFQFPIILFQIKRPVLNWDVNYTNIHIFKI